MSFGLARGRQLDVSGVGADVWRPAAARSGRLDPRAWFDDPGAPLRDGDRIGEGTFLVQEAPLHPGVNFLGFEWAGEFFRYAADRVRRNAIANVRILHGDATEFITHWWRGRRGPRDSPLFSDPWPKKRHHKRRVVQDRTLREFHRVLEPDGAVHLVTDHDDLWAWYEDHAARAADLFERCAFAPPRSRSRARWWAATSSESTREKAGRFGR